MQVSLFFEISDWLTTAALAVARVIPVFFVLPFFVNSVLTETIRWPVAILLGFCLWPYESVHLEQDMTRWLVFAVIIKELVIGAILAFFLALPFWTLHAVGSIIDNQRGATLSGNMDPISGVDTSELANFFNLFAAVIVLQNGGLLIILEVFEKSYHLWRPLEMALPPVKPLLTFMATLLAHAIVLASPLVVAFLLVEVFLGIMARFSPQLNPFSLALTIKSVVAFLLLILYFTPIFPDKILSFQLFPELLEKWQSKAQF